MAGVGFQLNKMLMEDTYTSILKAYLYSAVISSGPWLLSILCLSFLGVLSPIILQEHGWSIAEWDVFGVTIVYIFAFSLITTGLITMIITRFIADKIYLKEKESIPTTYASILVLIIIIQGISGLIFFAFSSTSVFYMINAVALYVAISCIWTSLIFLSASQNYNYILFMFFLGSVISLIAALLGGRIAGLTGFLGGYTIGQVVIVIGFSYLIFSEFGNPRSLKFDFLSYCKDYYELIFIGLFYYLAIWTDKFIFWFSEKGSNIYGLFYNFTEYDSALFIAYITIIPSLAIFLLNIETDFYESYKTFYEFVMDKKSFSKIHKNKTEMQKVIRRSLIDLLKVQGVVSFLAVYFAPEILLSLHIPNPQSILIFRFAVTGAFFHAYILIITIILLYYDLRKETLLITAFFAAANTLFTIISLNLGDKYYGSGYTLACILTCFISFFFLGFCFKKLEYRTFTGQPILGKRTDSPKLKARPDGGYGKYVDLDEARAKG